MLSKEVFKSLMEMVMDMEDTDHRLQNALQEYTGDKDFTGWATDRPTRLLHQISEAMGDDDSDWLGWWLWDCPERGKAKDKDCYTVRFNGKEYVLETLDDLYDFLLMEKIYSQSENSDFDKGVEFALGVIAKMRDANKKTKNDEWEKREALLKYTYDKIENEAYLKSPKKGEK